MSQTEKAKYFQELKAAGVTFERHYREYTTEQLKQAWETLQASQPAREPDVPVATPETAPPPDPEAAAFFGFKPEPVPVAEKNPNEMPGQRLNAKDAEDPIRVDDDGRVWLQEEVLKPAYPKPRGRRVLDYMDPGVEQRTVRAGEYQESFEVSGDPANARPAQVKITLPSYQVGIYRDPRFPFKVITYNGTNGFDLFDVQNYYGGSELVPAEIKRVYVENVLCYDIRTTIRAIEAEYRRLQLAKGGLAPSQLLDPALKG